MLFHHVGYIVNDIDTATQKFVAIGYRIEREKFYVKNRQQWNVYLTNNGNRIELVQPDGSKDGLPKSAATGSLGKNIPGGTGPYHIGFETEEFDKDSRILTDEGFLPISKTEIEPAYNNGRLQFFYNHNIGIVELIESSPDTASGK